MLNKLVLQCSASTNVEQISSQASCFNKCWTNYFSSVLLQQIEINKLWSTLPTALALPYNFHNHYFILYSVLVVCLSVCSIDRSKSLARIGFPVLSFTISHQFCFISTLCSAPCLCNNDNNNNMSVNRRCNLRRQKCDLKRSREDSKI